MEQKKIRQLRHFYCFCLNSTSFGIKKEHFKILPINQDVRRRFPKKGNGLVTC